MPLKEITQKTIGQRVKGKVFQFEKPSKAVALTLDVQEMTLSHLFNGKSAFSPGMAADMQMAYKISFAPELRLQAEFNLVQKLKERGIHQPLYDVEHPRELFQDFFGTGKLKKAEVARKIGADRKALANFINGPADLSPRMACTLAQVFEPKYGLQYSKEGLLAIQSDWDLRQIMSSGPILKNQCIFDAEPKECNAPLWPNIIR